MKKGVLVFSLAVAMVFAVCPDSRATGEGWIDNFEQAKARAAAEGKDILMDFTGSDWCGWCIKLDNEVFKQEAFQAAAPKDFILMVVDFPKDKSLVSEETAKQNEQLKNEFAVPGFPTLYLTDAAGRPYAKAGYQAGGPENYLKYLAGLKAVGQERNEKLAAARAEQDELVRAKQIDEALDVIDPNLVSQFYAAEILQIMDLDAGNAAGLKGKYQQMSLDGKLEGLLRQGKMDEAADAVKETLAAWALPEAEAETLANKYDRMLFEARLEGLLRKGKSEEATDLMVESLADWQLPEEETARLKETYELKIFGHSYWGLIYQERFDDAIACIEEWIETRNPDGQTLFDLQIMVGRIHGMKGDVETAVEKADEMIKEYDLQGDALQQALLIKLNAYQSKGDEENESKIIEEVIAAAPESDRSKYFLQERAKKKNSPAPENAKPVSKKGKPLPLLDRFTEALPAPAINDHQVVEGFAKRFGEMVDAGVAKTCSELVAALGDSKKDLIAPDRVAASAASQLKTPSAIYRDHIDSVLMFANVYKCGKCTRWHPGNVASAWVWGEKGILVTNYHLIRDKDNNNCVAVMTRDGRIFPVVELLAADESADIAVVRVDLGEETLKPLALGPSPEIGDDVTVLSNPKQRLFSLTKGYVSRYFHRPADSGEGMITQMTITADFSSGSSGGPILDNQGRVVGMVSSTVSARASKKGTDGKPEQGDIQMVFKDSVPVAAIRALLKSE